MMMQLGVMQWGVIQWSSWAEFFAMGGYAFYVWWAFGLTAGCLLWEVLALRRRYRQAAAERGMTAGRDG